MANSSASKLPPHPAVEILSERTAWSGRFSLEEIRFRQRRFDGAWSGERRWELWRRGRAAALLPYDPQADAVVLIEQFRLPALAARLDPVMVEVPAGLCDEAEAAEATAIRETGEEVGLTVDRVERIGDFLLTPGGSDEVAALFVGQVRAPAIDADGFSGTAGVAAEQEDIRARVWPAMQAIETALAGGFPNSVTSLALLWLASRRDWLRAHWSRP